jgi:hypothetical protein
MGSAVHSFMSSLLGWMWVRVMVWFKEEKMPVGRQIVSERLNCLLSSARAQEEKCTKRISRTCAFGIVLVTVGKN